MWFWGEPHWLSTLHLSRRLERLRRRIFSKLRETAEDEIRKNWEGANEEHNLPKRETKSRGSFLSRDPRLSSISRMIPPEIRTGYCQYQSRREHRGVRIRSQEAKGPQQSERGEKPSIYPAFVQDQEKVVAQTLGRRSTYSRSNRLRC